MQQYLQKFSGGNPERPSVGIPEEIAEKVPGNILGRNSRIKIPRGILEQIS